MFHDNIGHSACRYDLRLIRQSHFGLVQCHISRCIILSLGRCGDVMVRVVQQIEERPWPCESRYTLIRPPEHISQRFDALGCLLSTWWVSVPSSNAELFFCDRRSVKEPALRVGSTRVIFLPLNHVRLRGCAYKSSLAGQKRPFPVFWPSLLPTVTYAFREFLYFHRIGSWCVYLVLGVAEN